MLSSHLCRRRSLDPHRPTCSEASSKFASKRLSPGARARLDARWRTIVSKNVNDLAAFLGASSAATLRNHLRIFREAHPEYDRMHGATECMASSPRPELAPT